MSEAPKAVTELVRLFGDEKACAIIEFVSEAMGEIPKAFESAIRSQNGRVITRVMTDGITTKDGAA